ncbi:hypothetical protein ACJMK2_010438 [Sinanodonta woodiana]|uniref:Endonuclease/exonuclease/phosphatase domain-containing protein n=1 Tax=Sinanodonta woodiana TaxID=1069815 RepID=A0ABD3VFD7_SINWO
MPHREQKHQSELRKSLEIIDQNNITSRIITGDFNCPNIDWNLHTVNGPDRETQQELADIMSLNNLTQVHEQPTRENNLLDLVFVSNPTLIQSSVNVPGISDHDIIITDIDTKVQCNKTPTRKCYVYKNANWDIINKDLQELKTIIENKLNESVQEIWNTFKSNLFRTMDANIPNKEIRSRNNIPWLKKKQIKMLERKQRLYRQATQKKSGQATDPSQKNANDP